MKIFHKYDYIWFLVEENDDENTVKKFIVDCVTYFLGETLQTVRINRAELNKMCKEIVGNKQKAYLLKGLKNVRNIVALLKSGELMTTVDGITEGRDVHGISVYENDKSMVDIHLEKRPEK